MYLPSLYTCSYLAHHFKSQSRQLYPRVQGLQSLCLPFFVHAEVLHFLSVAGPQSPPQPVKWSFLDSIGSPPCALDGVDNLSRHSPGNSPSIQDRLQTSGEEAVPHAAAAHCPAHHLCFLPDPVLTTSALQQTNSNFADHAGAGPAGAGPAGAAAGAGSARAGSAGAAAAGADRAEAGAGAAGARADHAGAGSAGPDCAWADCAGLDPTDVLLQPPFCQKELQLSAADNSRGNDSIAAHPGRNMMPTAQLQETEVAALQQKAALVSQLPHSSSAALLAS